MKRFLVVIAMIFLFFIFSMVLTFSIQSIAMETKASSQVTEFPPDLYNRWPETGLSYILDIKIH